MIKQTKKEYDQWHSNQEIDFDVNTIWHSFIINQLNEDITKRKDILEIGCGRGGFAFWLFNNLNNYKSFTAADFSTLAIKKAHEYSKTMASNNINWEVRDIQDTNYKSQSFDLIFSFETIEHVPKPSIAIKELYRILRPGGILFLTCPNYLNLFGIYRIIKRISGNPFQEQGQPINKFITIPYILYTIKKFGFRLKHFDSEDFVVPRFKKPPRHLRLDKNKFTKFFGLQSFYILEKGL